MANKEVKLIDAELLTTNIAQIAKNCARSDAQKALVGRILFMIDNMPTIEVEPVNTDKCKALRNIEGIRLILSNVYNTGSTLQDCDYDAIYKRLDVIENILKGE